MNNQKEKFILSKWIYVHSIQAAVIVVILTHLSFNWEVLLEGIKAVGVLYLLAYAGSFIHWEEL